MHFMCYLINYAMRKFQARFSNTYKNEGKYPQLIDILADLSELLIILFI